MSTILFTLLNFCILYITKALAEINDLTLGSLAQVHTHPGLLRQMTKTCSNQMVCTIFSRCVYVCILVGRMSCSV